MVIDLLAVGLLLPAMLPPLLTGYCAASHGRSFWLWFVLGALAPGFSLLALIGSLSRKELHPSEQFLTAVKQVLTEAETQEQSLVETAQASGEKPRFLARTQPYRANLLPRAAIGAAAVPQTRGRRRPIRRLAKRRRKPTTWAAGPTAAGQPSTAPRRAGGETRARSAYYAALAAANQTKKDMMAANSNRPPCSSRLRVRTAKLSLPAVLTAVTGPLLPLRPLLTMKAFFGRQQGRNTHNAITQASSCSVRRSPLDIIRNASLAAAKPDRGVSGWLLLPKTLIKYRSPERHAQAPPSRSPLLLNFLAFPNPVSTPLLSSHRLGPGSHQRARSAGHADPALRRGYPTGLPPNSAGYEHARHKRPGVSRSAHAAARDPAAGHGGGNAAYLPAREGPAGSPAPTHRRFHNQTPDTGEIPSPKVSSFLGSARVSYFRPPPATAVIRRSHPTRCPSHRLRRPSTSLRWFSACVPMAASWHPTWRARTK
nr:hypothetical protein [Tanacetum cinerariifolium]